MEYIFLFNKNPNEYVMRLYRCRHILSNILRCGKNDRHVVEMSIISYTFYRYEYRKLLILLGI